MAGEYILLWLQRVRGILWGNLPSYHYCVLTFLMFSSLSLFVKIERTKIRFSFDSMRLWQFNMQIWLCNWDFVIIRKTNHTHQDSTYTLHCNESLILLSGVHLQGGWRRSPGHASTADHPALQGRVPGGGALPLPCAVPCGGHCQWGECTGRRRSLAVSFCMRCG